MPQMSEFDNVVCLHSNSLSMVLLYFYLFLLVCK